VREELAECGVLGGSLLLSWPLIRGTAEVVGLYEGSWEVIGSVVLILVVMEEDLASVSVLVVFVVLVVVGLTLDSQPGTLEPGFEDCSLVFSFS
jgi:hypothetical protein